MNLESENPPYRLQAFLPRGNAVGALVLAVLLAAMFLATCPANATVSSNGIAYYIDVTNGNNSWSGTSPTFTGGRTGPWANPQPINYGGSCYPVAAGTTIYFLPGVIQTQDAAFESTSLNLVNAYGTSNAPIVVAPYNGATVIFTNSGPNNNQLNMDACAWVKIYGLQFTNGHRTPILQNCTNCEIVSNFFGQTIDTSGLGPLTGPFTVYNNCVSNWIHNNVSGPSVVFWNSNGDAGEHGAVLGTYFSSQDNSYGNIIESNTFFGGGHDTLAVYGQSNLVQYNLTYSVPQWSFSQIGYLFGSRGFDIGGGNGVGNIVQYNDVDYCGQDCDQPGAITIDNGGLTLLRFNRIAGAAGNAIQVYGKGGTGPAGSNYILNNSAMLNSYNVSWTTSGALTNISYPTWQHPIGFASTSNNMVVNNLLYWNFVNTWTFNEGASVDVQVCLNNLTNVDPLFTDTNSSLYVLHAAPPFTPPDFHLLPGSPAIAAGTWPTAITSASGSGTSFTVSDSHWFFAGQSAAWRTVFGDTIQLQGQTVTAVITSISGNTITVATPLSWTNGQGVAMAYPGSAPDVGAFEYYPLAAPTDLRIISGGP